MEVAINIQFALRDGADEIFLGPVIIGGSPAEVDIGFDVDDSGTVPAHEIVVPMAFDGQLYTPLMHKKVPHLCLGSTI